jgi:hypothetical protein
MKLIVKTAKPRNPLVAPSLQRKAGAHRSPRGAMRQQGECALKRELDAMVKRSP